jgi:uncharacterized protein (TIGR02594 family)
MGFVNSACYVTGSVVIVIATMGGIETGSKLPPRPSDTQAEGGGAPGIGGSSTTAMPGGWDPANLPPGTGATPWMDSAGNYLGLTESPGNRGELIDQWNQKYGGYVGAPWCATYVNAMLDANGIQGTGSAFAQDFARWGVDAGGPVTGSVAVFRWSATAGHVGFVHSVNSDGSINVLGGNQNGGTGVAISRFTTDQVIGYRLPPGTSGGGVNIGGGNFGDGGGLEDTR